MGSTTEIIWKIEAKPQIFLILAADLLCRESQPQQESCRAPHVDYCIDWMLKLSCGLRHGFEFPKIVKSLKPKSPISLLSVLITIF